MFEDSGLHSRNPRYVKNTHLAVFKITEKNGARLNFVPVVVQNTEGGKHAEENCLLELEIFLIKMKKTRTYLDVSVEMFINFSPCYKCSPLIIAFICSLKELDISVTFEIFFPHLYRIRKTICLSKNCSHLPSEEEHFRQARGLKDLFVNGIHLKTFDEGIWQRLAGSLGFFPSIYYLKGRKRTGVLPRTFVKSLGIRSRNRPISLMISIRLNGLVAEVAQLVSSALVADNNNVAQLYHFLWLKHQVQLTRSRGGIDEFNRPPLDVSSNDPLAL